MRNTIPVLMLLVLFLPVGSVWVAFKTKQYHIRKNIKRRIKQQVNEKDLVVLHIPKALEESPNKLFQRIHAREFRYHGQMYDIVKWDEKQDTTTYYCIWDKEETGLFAKLDEQLCRALGGDPVNQENNRRLNAFFKTIYCQHYIRAPEDFYARIVGCLFAPFIVIIPEVSVAPFTPPPEKDS